MNTPNPFAPPSANLNAPPANAGSTFDAVPPSVIAILGATRPWLRLMLGLIVTGMVLVGMLVVGWSFLGGYGAGRAALSFAAIPPLLLVMSFYLPPAFYLHRCAEGIRRLQAGGGVPALEDTLRSQKSFWKYLGILALVLIAIYALAFVAISLGTKWR
jgi:hypothetical protein